jgi:hypothetical protein
MSRNHPPREINFPQLYLKHGNDWDPKLKPPDLEDAITTFKQQMAMSFQVSRHQNHEHATYIQRLIKPFKPVMATPHYCQYNDDGFCIQ